MKSEPRTVREFVEDMLSDGKEGKDILTVVRNTHWSTKIEEVKEVLKSFSGILEKRFSSFV